MWKYYFRSFVYSFILVRNDEMRCMTDVVVSIANQTKKNTSFFFFSLASKLAAAAAFTLMVVGLYRTYTLL